VLWLTNVQTSKSPRPRNPFSISKLLLFLIDAEVDLCLVGLRALLWKNEAGAVAVALLDTVNEDKDGETRRDVAFRRHVDAEFFVLRRHSDIAGNSSVLPGDLVLTKLVLGWSTLDGAGNLLECGHRGIFCVRMERWTALKE